MNTNGTLLDTPEQYSQGKLLVTVELAAFVLEYGAHAQTVARGTIERHVASIKEKYQWITNEEISTAQVLAALSKDEEIETMPCTKKMVEIMLVEQALKQWEEVHAKEKDRASPECKG